MKSKNEWRNKVYAEYLNKNNESVDYIILQNLIAEVSELVCKSMNDYHKQLARKLTNQKTGSKTYWSILENILQWKESSTNTTTSNK